MTNSSARRLHAACLMSGLLILSACATPEGPPASIAAAQSSIDAASADGAAEFSAAELAQARNKLERARQLASSDRLRAHRMAEEAGADAELARARAAQQRSRRALDEVKQSLQTLREELQRSAAQVPSPAASR
jgi:multidrug resistance efflux pump